MRLSPIDYFMKRMERHGVSPAFTKNYEVKTWKS